MSPNLAELIEDPLLPNLGEVFEFLRAIWAFDHALQKTSRRMAATLGITGPQRLILRIVGRFPGLPAGHLARILHVDPSTLTGVLKRLERSKLVRRRSDPRDRRRALFGLTPSGKQLAGLADGTVEFAAQQVLSGLSKDEVNAARNLLKKLAETLDPPASCGAAPSRFPSK